MNKQVKVLSYIEIAEKEFQESKKYINFRLNGYNKYYYANQCKRFKDNVIKNGYSVFNQSLNLNHLNDEIRKKDVSFHKHSINIGHSQFGTDLKTFKNKDELLGFVIGYNQADEEILSKLDS